MYTPKERLIYKYHDGNSVRYADPLALYRSLLSYPDLDLSKDLALIETAGDSRAGIEALDRLVLGCRECFDLDDWTVSDEGEPVGLLDHEVLELLLDFIGYVLHVKKNIERSATSLVTTAQQHSEESTTNVSLDSTSIDSVPSIVKPHEPQ